LDGVIDYLPSPADIGSVVGYDANDHEKLISVNLDDESPFTALSFKVISDPFVGRLNFIRIYSGILKLGSSVENTTLEKKEKINKIFRVYSNKREEISEAYSGEIVAVPQMKFTSTGDTLCINRKLVFDKIRFLEPMIDMSIEAKTLADQEKMIAALAKFADEDPTFRFKTDEESGQIIISGVGELQLEIAVDRLKREHNIEARAGKPQVSYRETISQSIIEEYRYDKQHAGKSQSGWVKIAIEPNVTNKGNEVISEINDKKINKVILDAALNGLKESLQMGMQGYPLVDVKVKLLEVEFIENITTELGTKIAASNAIKEGLRKIGTIILEPIFKVEITSPEQYVGDIISDLNSRKGRINSLDAKGNIQIISGEAPLSNLFGYVSALRTLSQGRAGFTMTFSQYSPAQ